MKVRSRLLIYLSYYSKLLPAYVYSYNLVRITFIWLYSKSIVNDLEFFHFKWEN